MDGNQSKVRSLIVGLGNPGPKYERTRHNVGFRFLDDLVDHDLLAPKMVGQNTVGHNLDRVNLVGREGQSIVSRVRIVGSGWVERFEGLFAEAEVTILSALPARTAGAKHSLVEGGRRFPEMGSRGVPGAEICFKAVLLKPLTFMNRSGASVGAVAKRLSLKSWQVVVCHDELDIAFGEVRSKRGGGEAGHNGLKSISQVLSTRDYYRIRLGIGRPPGGSQAGINGEGGKVQRGCGEGGNEEKGAKEATDKGVVDWVLGRFSQEEEVRLPAEFEKGRVHLALSLRSIGEAVSSFGVS